ncbi:MAG: pyridoxal-phosphate dependent enzyme, partial [Chloroflexi bacterium]|nr:pyridoxal-phosphate dependent enzyme [Chloroflexota bacterium]
MVRETPVLDLEPGALGLPGRLSLKLELLQHTGSFKARGAFNLLLARDVPSAGVVAASGGNFGLAIAYAARALGHSATIFVPEATVEVKRAKLRTLGANLVVTGAYYADALAASLEHAQRTGALVAHAYDQPEVVAGGGVCALELESQRPRLDTVLVAVGGGGLIGGVATWYGGRARVISVESEQTATMAAALAAGRPVDVEVSGIAADALGARRIGDLGFA